MIYIVYDADLVSDDPIYGVFDSEEAKDEAIEYFTNKAVEYCLGEDPKESGLNDLTEKELEKLRKECRESFAVKTFWDMNSKINY